VTQARFLDVESYDTGEAKAAERFPIRINQAFFPEMFASVGYPARVARVDQLWRYIDVMHETRTTYNMDHLLHGLTTREFELFKEVTCIVDSHATKNYGRRAHATAALLRVYRSESGVDFTFPITAWPPSFTCTCSTRTI